MLPRIPKKMCNQSIKIKVANGKEDDYGHVQTDDVTFNHVLVQPQTIYSGTVIAVPLRPMQLYFCLRVSRHQCRKLIKIG